jgi:tripartite-type tricarboxylate transporter receptor subunit TctC
METRLPRLLVLILALLCWLAPPAAAQAWPNRPVRLIVPYGPGGSTDNSARAFADKLSLDLGQQFVVENKGGAAGAIGVEAAAKAAPDGYTLVVAPLATLVVLPHGRPTAYDPFKDFTYVGRFCVGTLVIAISPALPSQTLQEFITFIKANPGKYFNATGGVGSMPHLAVEALKELAGIDMVHVPYRGGAEALTDFLAGTVHMVNESNTLPHVKAGKARLLAVIDSERHPDYPDVPIVGEVVPGYDVTNWFGIAGPAGMAPEIAARLSAALNKAAILPDVAARLLPLGLRPVADTPAAMAADVAKQYDRYGAMMRRLNIKME